MSELPKKISKYKIEGVLGKGAMGAVYLAHDPFVDRKVAIKLCTVLDNDDGSSTRARKMFFNEAQAAGALDHVNILRIFDAGETDNEPYIVMEFVDGGNTLKPFCKPGNLMDLETVVRLVMQVAKALDYAHRRGVTHRDIKPDNLMLTASGEIKIGDFGIAQRSQTDETQVMGTFGSPRYMSPEQVQDQKLTPQTDLYSLGVVLYELLTGYPPFKAQVLGSLVQKIIHEDPVPVKELRPEIPDSLIAVVNKALEKSTARRFKDGAEFATALSNVFGDVTAADEVQTELSEQEKFDELRGLHFFNDFSDSEIEEVLDVASWQQFKADEAMIREGSVDQSFYVIVQGNVSISIEGKEISTLSRGECLGEIGYLTPVKRIATITAATEVMAIKIDSGIMEWASISAQMRFNKAFQQTLIERLTSTTVQLAECRKT